MFWISFCCFVVAVRGGITIEGTEDLRSWKNDRSTDGAYEDKSSSYRVESLPGYTGEFASAHYSGFLTVGDKRHLYYYFVESENDPNTDPLLLWINGGPGCSSFFGFIKEHGPFNFDYNGGDIKLSKSSFAWSRISNMIYLDSPVGTGLSYEEGVDEYFTDDFQTMEDLGTAILKFFELFPEYIGNEFFITGESYAGIYVPLAVYSVLEHNKAMKEPHINIKGYIIGNGIADSVVDGNSFLGFAYGKSLISRQMYTAIAEACRDRSWQGFASECDDLQEAAYTFIIKSVNVYNVAGDCEKPPEGFPTANRNAQISNAMEFIRTNGLLWPLGHAPATGRVHNWRTATNEEAPCTDYWTLETWLNNAEVRNALHAQPYEVSGEFKACTDRIVYKKTIASVLGLHQHFVTEEGLHALIFSGDHDMAVPHTGTETWTSAIGLNVISDWSDWLYDGVQNGGFFVEYENLTYCTIRNAGHMPPKSHPAQTFEMIRRFLTKLSIRDPVPSV